MNLFIIFSSIFFPSEVSKLIQIFEISNTASIVKNDSWLVIVFGTMNDLVYTRGVCSCIVISVAIDNIYTIIDTLFPSG